jgi:sugar phosphate isomerase/epimerase
MLPRRTVLASPAALAAAARNKMTLGMHQFTSAAAGYRKSLEGWARAGIRQVEPAATLLDEFLRTDTLASAKRILSDNGLEIVSGAAGTTGLWEPNPAFARNLEALKRRCQQFAELGAPVVYSPCVTSGRFAADDYTRAVDQARQAADVARQAGIKIAAEFVRSSTFLRHYPRRLSSIARLRIRISA